MPFPPVGERFERLDEYLRDLHYLLLVNNNAVSGFEYGLKRLMLILCVGVSHLGASELAVNKIVHHT